MRPHSKACSMKVWLYVWLTFFESSFYKKINSLENKPLTKQINIKKVKNLFDVIFFNVIKKEKHISCRLILKTFRDLQFSLYMFRFYEKEFLRYIFFLI